MEKGLPGVMLVDSAMSSTLRPVPLWAAGLAWSEVAANRERNRKRALMGRVKLAGGCGLSVEVSGGGEGVVCAAGALEDPVSGGDLDHWGGVTDAFLVARGVGAVAEGAAGRWVDWAGDIACGEVALRAV